MFHVRRTRLELPARVVVSPWLVARDHIAALPSQPALVEVGGVVKRVDARALATHGEVMVFSLAGTRALKATWPLSALVAGARLAPRRLVHLDSGASYRYLRADGESVVAVAQEQMVTVANLVLPLRRALELVEEAVEPEKKPAPQAV